MMNNPMFYVGVILGLQLLILFRLPKRYAVGRCQGLFRSFEGADAHQCEKLAAHPGKCGWVQP